MSRGRYGSDYENVNYGHYDDGSNYDRAAERKKMYRRRRIIRRRIIASILMLLIVAVILLVVSLFIHVKEITITGNFGNYTYDEVLNASGVEEGDKLLYITAESVENEIEKALPYMVNVSVKKQLFSKVIIEVDFCSEAYCLYTGGKYAVVNSDFKVLRFEENYEETDILKAVGLESTKVTLGETLEFIDSAKLEYFKKICDGLKDEPFGELAFVDVTDTLNLRAGFKNGFEIKFGNYTNLDYNLQWAATVIKELEQKHDEVNGTLDLSVFKKAYYTPSSGEEESVTDNP